MSFRITGLPAEPFQGLFQASDAELAAAGAVRRRADEPHSFPCRISLTDAEVGEELLLVNHEHHPVPGPYRSRFAVYVRPGEVRYDAIDQVPDQLRRRLLAARGYDGEGMLVDAEIVDGRELEGAINRLLAEPQIAYLHLHFARPGCYAARVDRA